jgi:LacI family transcriptional regulator
MSVIGAKAGVSKNTVSLALRGDPQIPLSTRERIERIARSLGYAKNPVVAQLMTELRKAHPASYRRTFALLNANLDPKAFTRHPTIPAYIAGCRRRAAQHGCSFDEFWLHDPSMDGESLARILRARGIRGVLVVGMMKENRLPERHRSLWAEQAVVVTGVRTHEPTFAFACVDHHALVLEAMAQARILGYSRPALVLEGSIDQLVEGRFSSGFWVGQQELRAKDRLPAYTAVDGTREAPLLFQSWVKKHRPDVIFTLHTVVREWLEAGGLNCPADIGLIQLERRRGCEDWAGMEQHNDLAGEAALDMLISQLHTGDIGLPSFPRATLIGASWTHGNTVRSMH